MVPEASGESRRPNPKVGARPRPFPSPNTGKGAALARATLPEEADRPPPSDHREDEAPTIIDPPESCATRRVSWTGGWIITHRRGYNRATRIEGMPTYEPGDFIKVEFPDEATGVAEWMWVRVQRCDNEKRIVFGNLDNAPLSVYDNKLKLGSELAVGFENIRGHRKPSEFSPSN